MTTLIQLITALQQLCETPKAALVLRRLGILLKWTAWLATILLIVENRFAPVGTLDLTRD